IANALIPKLIREISENHPNLKLNINEGLTKEIIDDLENDRLDVGIVSTPVKHNGLVERNLYTEKFRIYAHPDHPCYSKKAWEATDLLEDKLWLLSEGNCFRVQTINLCSLPDEKLNHLALTYESGSLQTLKKIVDFEGGATIIPEWEASELDDDSLDNLRAFRADDAGRAVGLIYTKFYAKDQVINRLEEMIMNCLPRYVSENKNLKIIES
ncbi:LysR substrate-binding domain-containing protein, partial [Bacteroidia bacterium]|nr:LysR substrate-binding domain-containing protein [Bacteroidia bacterium]